jgi:hypothetical protein
VKGTLRRVAGVKRQRTVQKVGELRRAHLARGHRKLSVTHRSEAARVAVDAHVIRRIGEHQIGLLPLHERGIGAWVEGVSAQHAVLAQQPQITRARYRRPLRYRGKVIRSVFRLARRSQAFDPEVDLAHLEAGRLQAEIQIQKRQLLQLLGQ